MVFQNNKWVVYFQNNGLSYCIILSYDETFGIVDRQGQWSAYHNQGNQNTSNIEYSHFNWNGNEWILNKRYQQHVIKLTIFIF